MKNAGGQIYFLHSLLRNRNRLEFHIELVYSSVCLRGNAKQSHNGEDVDLKVWYENLHHL
jgi:hypothetical protein